MTCRGSARIGIWLVCLAPVVAVAAEPAAHKGSRDRVHRLDPKSIDVLAHGRRPTPPGFAKFGLMPNASPRSNWAISRNQEFSRPLELGSANEASRSIAASSPATMLLPGEFERQSAVVLGCGQLASFAPETLAEVAEAVRHELPVIALAPNAECRQDVLRALHKRKLAPDAVQFLAVQHDTMWARDYGPLLVRQADGSPALVDANYAENKRHQDDAVPKVLGRRFGLPVFQAPLAIEGGNLLSNGAGVCLTTQKVLETNLEKGAGESDVRRALRDFYGAEQSVFLEPLSGEPTGHVDMFACFTSADTVVVGRYDPAVDPANAAILDRNAATLAGLRTSVGALKVERAPMPSNADGVWRTYTNVVFANDTLLMPTYKNDDAQRDEALMLYRRLLPNRKIVPIDATTVIEMGGALHCLTLNLTEVTPPPKGDEVERISDARTARVIPARRPRRGR